MFHAPHDARARGDVASHRECLLSNGTLTVDQCSDALFRLLDGAGPQMAARVLQRMQEVRGFWHGPVVDPLGAAWHALATLKRGMQDMLQKERCVVVIGGGVLLVVGVVVVVVAVVCCCCWRVVGGGVLLLLCCWWWCVACATHSPTVTVTHTTHSRFPLADVHHSPEPIHIGPPWAPWCGSAVPW